MSSLLSSARRLAWLSLGLLAACAAAETPPAKPTPKPGPVGAVPANVAELQNKIRDEIGDPVCSSNDQCRTVAIGYKACGGPEAYRVWSTQVSNGSRLLALAEAYQKARREENQLSGRVSDCSMVVDPGARCEAGRCVPAGRGPAVM
ncbi:MAG: hypothetical protein ACOZJX_18065 [Pseudomonadota bacterium]